MSEMIFNCLAFVDFEPWTKKEVERVLESLYEIEECVYESNRIMYCYNYIMSICLCCEIIKKVGETYIQMRDIGTLKIKEMLTLGDKIIDNLNDDSIKKFFLDRDFKNRTVLRIITDNKFYPLLSSEKVNRLIQEIWVGVKSYECDGTLSDLS